MKKIIRQILKVIFYGDLSVNMDDNYSSIHEDNDIEKVSYCMTSVFNDENTKRKALKE